MKNKLSANTILDGIKEGKTITMNCYTLTDNFVKKNLETVLRNIPQHYEKTDLLPAILGLTGTCKLDLCFPICVTFIINKTN